MKKPLLFLMILSFCLAKINSANAQTWGMNPNNSSTTPYMSYATTTSPTAQVTYTLNPFVYGASLTYTFATPQSIGNGYINFGVNSAFTNATLAPYLFVTVTDNLNNTTTANTQVSVVSIPSNTNGSLVYYTMDMNAVNPLNASSLPTVNFASISKISFIIENSPTGFVPYSGLKGNLTISNPTINVTGGTSGATIIANPTPTLPQEWVMEGNNFINNANNGGVLIGKSAGLPTQLLSWPYYQMTVNGRANFVGDLSALNVWSSQNPASGYKHYLSFSNQTYPSNGTTEFSMINAYEWNGTANRGNAKTLILQNFPDPNGIGNLGIGYHIDAPTEKLSVNGNIKCKKLIATASGWADYVFANNYQIMSLSELKQFIAENHHLPNIPSEKSLNEKGLDVGDMMKLQMEKIEELTLYIIKQQEQIEALQKDLKTLKSNK